MKAKAGDIVKVDLSLEYQTFTAKYTALVLHESNGQPLFTRLDNYSPHWGTYGEVAEIIGHIDLETELLAKAKEAVKSY